MNKKKITSLSIALALTTGLFSGMAVQAAQYYPDVDEGHWAYEWVGLMQEKGYIHGYPDGNYYPANNITRAEFVTILNFIFKSTKTEDKNFSDVHSGDWYYDYIQAAVSSGYLHGYNDATEIDDGTIKPNSYITREEAAVVIAGAFSLPNSENVSTFTDSNKISDWAVPYVSSLAESEIIVGDAETGNFRPQDNMLRAEVASMIAQAINKTEPGVDDKTETVTLPNSFAAADGVYSLSDITVKNVPVDHKLLLTVDAIADGDVGSYKVVASLNGITFADGVTLDALKAILTEKTFTGEELSKLTIVFTEFSSPATDSSLKISVNVVDTADSNKPLASKDYTISFGEKAISWPADITEKTAKSHTISGIKSTYNKDSFLDISEKTTGNVGSYTLDVTLGATTLAKGATLDEVKRILAEKKLTAADINSLKLTISAAAPENKSSLSLTLKLLDAETKAVVGDEMTYVITYTVKTDDTSGGGSMSGGGTTITDVDSKRDRVIESLKDYQSGITNTSGSKKIANDYNNHRISNDMIMVIITNDGMTTFNSTASQTKDAKKVESAFSAMKSGLHDEVGGDSCYAQLYPLYEKIIAYVMDNEPSLKNAVLANASDKEQYVHLFRAMVETINGSADAAIDVYNNPKNSNKTANEKFVLFKDAATNNTTAALLEHLLTIDNTLKNRIVDLALSYCTDLFDANKGNTSLKEDLGNLKAVTLTDFSTILKKYM